jgi:hypothetical protein
MGAHAASGSRDEVNRSTVRIMGPVALVRGFVETYAVRTRGGTRSSRFVIRIKMETAYETGRLIVEATESVWKGLLYGTCSSVSCVYWCNNQSEVNFQHNIA